MNTKFKFGLTLAATLVLAACGSSGNKGGNTAENKPATPAQTQTQPATNTNTQTTDKALLQQDKIKYGGKFVKKEKSDFIVPGTNQESDSSGAAAAMTVALNPFLDTIVIASKVDSNNEPVPGSELIYLEDFDFRKNDILESSEGEGYTVLPHIHYYNKDGAAISANKEAIIVAKINAVTAELAKVSSTLTAKEGELTTKEGDLPAKKAAAKTDPSKQADYDAAVAEVDYLKAEVASLNVTKDRLTKTEENYQALKASLITVAHTESRTFIKGKAGAKDLVLDTVTRPASRDPQAALSKTEFAGNEFSFALVYKQDVNRMNYIKRSEKIAADDHRLEGGVDLSDNVAEVYGYRTFAVGDSLTGNGAGEFDVANTPLINARLHNVQYGRVTASLNGLTEEQLRPGVKQGTLETKIASYAPFKSEGSESSYFFRGVNPTAEAMKKSGADLVTALKQTYKDGQIKYQGHAVTYGFDHKYTGSNTGGVPNAIGVNGGYDELSGTHVSATVDLNTYKVNGRLYDIYTDRAVPGSKIDNTVATFDGTLTQNGNVEGSSVRVENDRNEAGSFKATLYGSLATELGGGIASNATDAANSWGAVFGAKAGSAAPANGIGVATDSSNRGK